MGGDAGEEVEEEVEMDEEGKRPWSFKETVSDYICSRGETRCLCASAREALLKRGGSHEGMFSIFFL